METFNHIFGDEPSSRPSEKDHAEKGLETEVSTVQRLIGNLACAAYITLVGAFCIYIAATWSTFRDNRSNLGALVAIFTVFVVIAACRLQQKP